MGLLNEKCLLAPLTKELRDKLKGFECSREPDIEKFFKEESVLNDRQLLSKTYCFYLPETMEAVAGFCVLSSDISVSLIPKRTRNKINRHIPYVKQRSQYPAVLVGQLVVFDKFSSLHLGDELLDTIKAWLVIEANQVASRYVIVDAVNKPGVLSFYERNFFQYVFPNIEDEIAANNMDSCDVLSTRFMISDLMPIYEQVLDHKD